MKNRLYITLYFVLMLPGFGLVAAQELIHPEPYQVNYDWVASAYPGPVVFNGVDHVEFYAHQADTDIDREIYCRRLKRDGVPTGPVRKVLERKGGDYVLAAVWDGEAYTLSCLDDDGKRVLVRVSKDLKTLGTLVLDDKYPHTFGWWKGDADGLQVVGDMVFLAFSSGSSLNNNRSYLFTCDKSLKGDKQLQEFPLGGMSNAGVLGMTLWPNGLIVAIGQRGTTVFGNEVKAVRLFEVAFNGEIIRGPFQLEENFGAAISFAGPVFDGAGLMFFYTQLAKGRTFNSDIRTDVDGRTVMGPVDLGDCISDYQWNEPLWEGKYVSCLYFEWTRFSMYYSLFYKNGHYVMNPIQYSGSTNIIVGSTFHAFTGTGSTVVFGVKRFGMAKSAVFSNQVCLPPSVKKPEIVFFESSGPYILDPDKRLIMWSATGCTNVMIRGKGIKLKQLPPVGARIIDTKGRSLKLNLTVKGPGGKAKRKLTI